MSTLVRWVAGITIAIVLVQAALIGQALFFGDASRYLLHGWLGNISFLGGVAVVVVSYVARRRGELGSPALTLSIVTALLMVVQIGLGYAGRNGGWPAALHVPNGVLVSTLLAALLTAAILSPSPVARDRV